MKFSVKVLFVGIGHKTQVSSTRNYTTVEKICNMYFELSISRTLAGPALSCPPKKVFVLFEFIDRQFKSELRSESASL